MTRRWNQVAALMAARELIAVNTGVYPAMLTLLAADATRH